MRVSHPRVFKLLHYQSSKLMRGAGDVGNGIEEGVHLLGIYGVREKFHPYVVSVLPKGEDMQIGRYAKFLKDTSLCY